MVQKHKQLDLPKKRQRADASAGGRSSKIGLSSLAIIMAVIMLVAAVLLISDFRSPAGSQSKQSEVERPWNPPTISAAEFTALLQSDSKVPVALNLVRKRVAPLKNPDALSLLMMRMRNAGALAMTVSEKQLAGPDDYGALREATLVLLRAGLSMPPKKDLMSYMMILGFAFFAMDVELVSALLARQELREAIGNTTWDGTPLEAWASPYPSRPPSGARIGVLTMLARAAETDFQMSTTYALNMLRSWGSSALPVIQKSGFGSNKAKYASGIDWGALYRASPSMRRIIDEARRNNQELEPGWEKPAAAYADVVRATDEAFSAIARLLLDSGFSIARQLSATWRNGHQPLHMMARSGLAKTIEVVANAALHDSRSRSALKKACEAQDVNKRTPLHHAALRWGYSSTTVPVLATLEWACAKAAQCNEVATCPAVEQIRAARDYFNRSIPEYAKVVDIPRAMPNRVEAASHCKTRPKDTDNGGWHRKTLKDLEIVNDPHEALLEQVDINASIRRDYVKQAPGCTLNSQALAKAAMMGEPVVFRGAALGWEGRKALKRSNFIKKLGAFRCTSSRIPYSDQFLGTIEEQKTLKDVAFAALDEGAPPGTSRLEHSSTYVFITSTDAAGCEQGFADALWKTVRPPKWLPKLDEKGMYQGNSQFYLGGRGTGSPLHLHTDAANVLAYGRKLYILYPPAFATLSVAPALEGLHKGAYNGSFDGGGVSGIFLNNETERLKQHGDYGAGVYAGLEFVQEAGDVVFVPSGWGHLILNLEPSIGVAYEMFGWEGQPIAKL